MWVVRSFVGRFSSWWEEVVTVAMVVGTLSEPLPAKEKTKVDWVMELDLDRWASYVNDLVKRLESQRSS